MNIASASLPVAPATEGNLTGPDKEFLQEMIDFAKGLYEQFKTDGQLLHLETAILLYRETIMDGLSPLHPKWS